MGHTMFVVAGWPWQLERDLDMFTIHAVLAGAYKGKRTNLKATLTHLSADGGDSALCGKVQEGNLADEYGTDQTQPATCKACLKKGG